MLTLKRLAVYLVTFFVTLLLLLVLIDDWKQIDTYLTGVSNATVSERNSVNNRIVVVDVGEQDIPDNHLDELTRKRQKLIQLLQAIELQSVQKDGPESLVLDLWFSSDNTLMDSLIGAIRKLEASGTRVYAAYDLNASHDGGRVEETDFLELEDEHALSLYNLLAEKAEGTQLSRGRYHTYFFELGEDKANYESEITLTASDSKEEVVIEFLPLRVVADLDETSEQKLEVLRRQGAVVPYGPLSEVEQRTYTFQPDSVLSLASFISPEGTQVPDVIDMDNKILLAANIEEDVERIGDLSLPMPYLVTWAMSDLLDGNIRVNQPLENLGAIIGQILFFSFFIALLFAILFKYIKKLQTKPLTIAVLSFIGGLLLLFIYYKLILQFNTVVPIGQTIAGMLVAVLLTWRFAYKFLTTGVVEGGEKYDVFISYSRGNSDWVKKHVYEPLNAYRKPNGDPISIFFDVKSIGIGEAFTSKYMRSIVDSRIFIPIISDEYYSKNHCRNEMDLAYKRSVEDLLEIMPIAFSLDCVPKIYTHINVADVSRNPDFMKDIKEKLSSL